MDKRQAILIGLMDQMKTDGRWDGREFGITCALDSVVIEEDEEFWDNTSGQPLDPSLVRKARIEEMEEVRKHTVYHKVPLEKCWEATGKRPMKVRWVDLNKGDCAPGIQVKTRS